MFRRAMSSTVCGFAICALLTHGAFAAGPASVQAQTVPHRFTIQKGIFALDGKPFQIVSGELHYARIPRAYWRQRLRMAKAMGLNTIATYVFWNYHEARPGIFDFRSGNRNLAEFLRIAQQEGLWVILRPGPYVCAEWDFGGLPAWLLKSPAMLVRSNDPRYLAAAERYIRAMAREVRPLLVTHGGPVLMVQVENEYGSFGSNSVYKERTRQMFVRAGLDVPLFTADGDWLLDKGGIPGVFAAANGEQRYDTLARRMTEFNGGLGPYMVAELYPGWLTHWAEPLPLTPIDSFLPAYDSLLRRGASVNLYMFHGGTNFAFTSGANYTRQLAIEPSMTSYDYGAPLSEAGWPTAKYRALREVISRDVAYAIPPVPAAPPVVHVPPIVLHREMDLYDLVLEVEPHHAAEPLSMEDMGQADGYVLYRHAVGAAVNGELGVPGLRDHGEVFVNGARVATLDRASGRLTASVSADAGAMLDIFVENMGRINYGADLVNNRKGIIQPVTIDGVRVVGWFMYPLPFSKAPSRKKSGRRMPPMASHELGVPTVYSGNFVLDSTADTFLDMRGWSRGIVFVNGVNLGRYWNIGPQQTLYLPGVWMHRGTNRITVFDLDGKRGPSVEGLPAPILGELHQPTTSRQP